MRDLQINNKKLRVVGRKDLPLPYEAVQSAHSSIDFQHEHPEIAKDWQQTSNYLIFLSADSEQHLERLVRKAESKGIVFTKFYEPDLNNELTAVTFEPTEKSRKILSNLPLMGRRESNA